MEEYTDKKIPLSFTAIIICAVVGIITLFIVLPHSEKQKKEIKIETFQYNQHDYIKFISPYDESCDIVHNPDCKHCFEIFD